MRIETYVFLLHSKLLTHTHTPAIIINGKKHIDSWEQTNVVCTLYHIHCRNHHFHLMYCWCCFCFGSVHRFVLLFRSLSHRRVSTLG